MYHTSPWNVFDHRSKWGTYAGFLVILNVVLVTLVNLVNKIIIFVPLYLVGYFLVFWGVYSDTRSIVRQSVVGIAVFGVYTFMHFGFIVLGPEGGSSVLPAGQALLLGLTNLAGFVTAVGLLRDR